jgi:hypothetical protein
LLLGTSQIGQAAGTLLCDQSLKSQTDQRGFLFDSSELGSIAQERIINVERCPHVHQDARIMHTGQVSGSITLDLMLMVDDTIGLVT